MDDTGAVEEREERRADPLESLFVTIGAMKCGTSSLHEYLAAHPDVAMSNPKELDFFVPTRNWQRGLDWYRARWERGGRVHGESSPNYTKYPELPGVAELMARVAPRAKLIYLLRDPIRRLLSHHVHLLVRGRAAPSLEELSRAPHHPLVQVSRYGLQLQRFLDRFPREQVLVLTLEQLSRAPEVVMPRVFDFLGVDPSFRDPAFGQVHHASADRRAPTWFGRLVQRVPLVGHSLYRRHERGTTDDARRWSRPVEPPRLLPGTRARLAELLAPDLALLRRLTGERFDEWSV